MRPNQQNNKQRSRGRNNGRRGGGNNPLSRNYESNGPDVKIRGNAAHIAEKYVQLARDATASGDGVMAENYLQHAEHYFRIILAAQGQYQPRTEQMTDTTPEDDEGTGEQVARQSETVAREDEQASQANGATQGDEAAEGEQRRPQRQRRPRRAKADEAAAAEGAEAEAKPAAAEEAAPVAGGEDKPKRTRRPRKKATEEASAETSELPAFLTAGREAAAE
ncbi:DUF4167 domain-containing protein [Pelagibacterium halotolerans]|uniref:DUF4167 domain-containing protein n=1 Tax=Pelagibacterium halotolerans TaxID=531813 RepID=UPI00384ED6DE